MIEQSTRNSVRRAANAIPAWIFTLFYESAIMIGAAIGVGGTSLVCLAIVLLATLIVYAVASDVDGWTLWSILIVGSLASGALDAGENPVAAFFIVILTTGAAYLLLDRPHQERASHPGFE